MKTGRKERVSWRREGKQGSISERKPLSRDKKERRESRKESDEQIMAATFNGTSNP